MNDVSLLSHQVSSLKDLLTSHSLVWFKSLTHGALLQAQYALQNGVYTVGGSLETPVKTSEVYKMLVDYPNLNKVFSSIDECHTLTEKQALQLLQVAPASKLLLSRKSLCIASSTQSEHKMLIISRRYVAGSF